MNDLADGESTQVKGSGSAEYTLKNTGGVYSCSCPAWRNQSLAIERRTCKHLRRFRAKKPSASASEPRRSQPPNPRTRRSRRCSWRRPGRATSTSPAGGSVKARRGAGLLERRALHLAARQSVHAPDWFTEGLPAVPLDGELWGGRRKFQRTVGIVKRQDKSDLWRELSFLVFDAPPTTACSRIESRAAASWWRTWPATSRWWSTTCAKASNTCSRS